MDGKMNVSGHPAMRERSGRDQAADLRALMAAREAAEAGREGRSARVIAVCSGKGGTGKSNVAANLAYLLARQGRKTVLADLDLGMANLDILLGLAPARTVRHLLEGRAALEDVLVAGPGGMRFLPGASGVASLADLDPSGRDRLLAHLEALERGAEILLLDVGAGIGAGVLSLVSAADEVLLVTTPEPTALLDAFAVLKVLAGRPASRASRVRVLVNQARDRVQAARVADRLWGVARQFLGMDVERLGYVLLDLQVPEAVRARRLVAEAWPRAAASRCLAAIARRIAGAPARARGGFFRRLFLGTGGAAPRA